MLNNLFFKQVYDSYPGFAFIIDIDDKIQYVNQHVLSSFKLTTPENLIGKGFKNVLSSSCVNHVSIIEELAIKGRASIANRLYMHYEINDQSFKIIQQLITSPIFDEDGRVSHISHLATIPRSIQLREYLRHGENIDIKEHVKFRTYSFLFEGNIIEFTKSEARCGLLLMAGLSSPKIAESLGISKRTVDNHIEKIKDKMDVDSRTKLIIELSNKSSFPDLFLGSLALHDELANK